MSCDIHTHTPAKKSSTNFLLHRCLIRKCYADCFRHGHGHECHSPYHTYNYGITPQYRRWQNEHPLLMRPPLHARSSPPASHLRPDPSWSAAACKINTRSRDETPRDDIPLRARGIYLGMCTVVPFAHDRC